MTQRLFRIALLLGSVYLASSLAFGETGREGWLRYSPIDDPSVVARYDSLPAVVTVLQPSAVLLTAQRELVRGVRNMLNRTLREANTLPNEDAFVLDTASELKQEFPKAPPPPSGGGSAFRLTRCVREGHNYWLVEGDGERGVLYGIFHVLEKIAQFESLSEWNEKQAPSSATRWVIQWDNMDGSIERGYAGRSIFFENGAVRQDLTRAAEYAHLLASVGLNGCTVNNVNADPQTLSTERLKQVARIADVFRPWGVQLSLSVDLSSPQIVGGLNTFDPLDPQVSKWWTRKANEIHGLIPDIGGFVVKADSEGRAGPSKYGRTPADAANVLARALQPYGGIVLYRGFVYNHHLDWRDLRADRARAGYDNFRFLDGKFKKNVIVQIKHGPIDFQVREPVSPLFAALRHTNEAIELQITQEYTGQQRHLVFLVPMWKTVLDTDLRAGGKSTPVKDIITGKSFGQALGGFIGVANVGLDINWLAHPLAMANLYGFGRLAWNPDESSEEIASRWTRLTFGSSRKVIDTITAMQLASWRIYENYTGPLGAGTLTDIIQVHYGPAIESSERNGWGQWHRADHEGIGMDRTIATGTGYIGQYPPELARVYESLATMPDNLLLFMHHVPYTYRLHSGQTVIQYIYDTHYEGAEKAAGLVQQWKWLRGEIDEERFNRTLTLLTYQAGHAIVWRDAICNWFFKSSGIPDEAGRVGHYPNRIEAEAMQLDGYVPTDVLPWETASGGKAVNCKRESACIAETILSRPAGWYNLVVQYFDPNIGAAQYQLYVNEQQVGIWDANLHLPSAKLDGHTSTRFNLQHVAMRPGDRLRIVGKGDGFNPAALDYIEVEPAGNREPTL
ncbi:MAG: alpha-glucuronidase family glycosyl hydrolase [Bryobacteraceae bacterium]